MSNEIAQLRAEIKAAFDALPGHIALTVKQQVDQYMASFASADQAQPMAAVEQGPAPASQNGGKSKLLEDLLPMALQAMMKQDAPQQDSIAKLAQTLESLGTLFQSVDKIRGVNQSGPPLSPQAALQWAKWGHELGRNNEPIPEFPVMRQHVPPSSDTGR